MTETNPFIAIACGGTGGHLFPGLAIAEALQDRGCAIALMVSQKEVDQQAIKSAVGMDVLTLPAVALQGGGAMAGFLTGGWSSYRICQRHFQRRKPRAVLAMGGFTSAPPILAGKACGALTFLHEANSIPGRANRWLAPLVDEAFVGYSTAARRLSHQTVPVTGTPVRPQFRAVQDAASCRMALGLDPSLPVLLVMGGSQGASAINELVCQALPRFAERLPSLQFLHLTGPNDREKTRSAHAQAGRRAVVLPFLTEMELALGAASVAISRAGASAIAEIAAVRVPSILIPYPAAMDNHQYFNARSLMETGAARQLDQASVSSDNLVRSVALLIENAETVAAMRAALAQWDFPNAAAEIAGHILTRAGLPSAAPSAAPGMAMDSASEGTDWPRRPLRFAEESGER